MFFFFLSCLQRAALLIAVDKLSVTLYENSLHSDTGNFLQETEFAKKGAANCSLLGENFLLNILKFDIKQSHFSPRFHVDICFNLMRISLLSTVFNLLMRVGVFRRFRETVKSDC